MIESFSYKTVKDSTHEWLDALPFFREQPVIEFKPGLNIVFGPNGSGKSGLLQLLGLTLAAVQGASSTVTTAWLRTIFGWEGDTLRLPCHVVHDGSPILYYDARNPPGLHKGQVDDEFYMLGLLNVMVKRSAGETVSHYMARLINALLEDIEPSEQPGAKRRKSAKDIGKNNRADKALDDFADRQRGFPTAIDWKLTADNCNSVWRDKLKAAEKLLAPKCAPGPKTFIFDEPESGFSLEWQAGIWENVFSRVDPSKQQVIIATHSPFALGIPGAHYIDTHPGYSEKCAELLSHKFGRPIA